MHVCMPEGLPEGLQWVHVLGGVKKENKLISVKFKEFPFMKNYSSSKIRGRNETSGRQSAFIQLSGQPINGRKFGLTLNKTWEIVKVR